MSSARSPLYEVDQCSRGHMIKTPKHATRPTWQRVAGLICQSGHMPGLRVQSPVRVGMRGSQWICLTSMFLSLSPSLSLSLKINKIFLKNFLNKTSNHSKKIAHISNLVDLQSRIALRLSFVFGILNKLVWQVPV